MKNTASITFRMNVLSLTLISAIWSSFSYGEEAFNIHALEVDNPGNLPEDLSQFTREGGQAPGVYRVTIWLNGNEADTRNLRFRQTDKGVLEPELTPAMLRALNVNTGTIAELQAQSPDAVIFPLAKYIPAATVDFDFSRQQLNITVPQALMTANAQGAVDPTLWDDGISALFTSYAFSGSSNWQKNENSSDTRSDNYFLSLRSGLNMGGWRLRNYSTWNATRTDNNTADQNQWDSINTWLQHDIKALKGQFILGDSYTPSDIFDSVQFRGAQIASDDNMLPDSLRGFAPVVRGIAQSNAQVTIRQNGTVIYQSYVPPGAFAINDLYPTSASGDLQVTIREADGSERTFIQPFSSVPIMQREGRVKYALTAGKYRSSTEGGDEPEFVQGTILYGLNSGVTLYGGTQQADRYRNVAAGVGLGLSDLGSVSFDVTQAWSELYTGDRQGQSLRFQYSKDIQSTDSTVTLAGYRYSTSGFYTFNEAADYRALREEDDDASFYSAYNKRSKVQVVFTQNIAGGEGGSLSFSGYQQDYWGADGYERNATISYNQNAWNINWTLSWSYISNIGNDRGNDQQFALNISIPLDRWLPSSYATAGFTSNKHGDSSYQTGLSGTALEQKNLSWSVGGNGQNHGGDNSGNVALDYKGSYGEVNGGYNYSPDNQRVNYGVQGSAMVHRWGLTLGQPIGGDMASIALVRAPQATGARVENNTGISTDWRGYTIVPWLSSYKRSRIVLDTASLGDDVDITDSVQQVVPTAGAVVLADYNTHVGSRVLLTLSRQGKPLPFGTMVTVNGDTQNTGIVSDNGKVYLSGVNDGDIITAQWGTGKRQRCQAKLALEGETNNRSGIIQATEQCQ